jgi:hypothetical protein
MKQLTDERGDRQGEAPPMITRNPRRSTKPLRCEALAATEAL